MTGWTGRVQWRPPAAGVVPPGFRTPALVAVVLAAALFATLAVRFAGEDTGGPLDRQVDPVVAAAVSPYWVTWRVVALASPPSVVFAGCLLAALSLWLRRWRLAVLALAGPGLAGLLTILLKPVIARTLDGKDTFPSGHTAGATAVSLVAVLLLVEAVPRMRRWGSLLVTVVGVLAAGCAGVAMVGEGLHYATDVVGGFCVAVLAVLGVALVLERLRSGPADERAALG